MKKVALIILDGWGHGKKNKANAIQQAKTPFIDTLYKNNPHSELLTDGEHVGLPMGQMGNSEVGHLNIGAGRVVLQDLVRINKAILDGSIGKNNELQKAFLYAKQNKVSLHLIGLLSDGGIHSHESHLHHLCRLANEYGLKKVFIHAFTDGRDTDPKSGITFIENLENETSHLSAELVSIVGRYFAMDRDKRWERIKIAYDLLCSGRGQKSIDLKKSLKSAYEQGQSDEFIKPITKVDADGKTIAKIKEGDVVICFNFRTDRCREITEVLTQKNSEKNHMRALKLKYVTMTTYDQNFKGVNVLFQKKNLKNTLGEVLSKNNKKQLRIAETEKYPHVSFFFSGGREDIFKGEKRIMVPSPKVATYDLQPSMSARKLTNLLTEEIINASPDFVCINFANPDMVGHTGVFEAVIEAIETVDSCTQQLLEVGIKKDYSFLILADHGNADFMVNENGSPNTNHTTNPVPCFLINTKYKILKNGKLADIAPTILKIMDLKIPHEMSGNTLV
ncbi:MAG: phosphoglycerate mutase (2,3-diphosphoglycerate-independent) [Flavobacteriales bacterium]|nr:phosphoglycerate mutase (2,3-diphosphoglycerate-independent) [Flavobacteriales bacterium]|tara:strand:- start:10487 stop:12001 length:1515 start_codon:yes stop_codon:yes gene_type:complete